jgi:L-rhamnose mutarotase
MLSHRYDDLSKWWAYMAPLMEVNPDNSPICADLPEVFHLDE